MRFSSEVSSDVCVNYSYPLLPYTLFSMQCNNAEFIQQDWYFEQIFGNTAPQPHVRAHIYQQHIIYTIYIYLYLPFLLNIKCNFHQVIIQKVFNHFPRNPSWYWVDYASTHFELIEGIKLIGIFF